MDIPKRTSCDQASNRKGVILLNLYITKHLVIINGRCNKDTGVGHYTCVGQIESSVIEYLICAKEFFKSRSSFAVSERTESSHLFLIEWSLEASFENHLDSPVLIQMKTKSAESCPLKKETTTLV